jgi:tetratricopeptide (TPR) repeat protein/transcriptional regulator with XRE-family HTH domain
VCELQDQRPVEGENRNSAFGTLLRGFREAAALSQASLARRAELTPQAISLQERGRRVPQLETVGRLAQALGLTPHDRARLLAVARGDPDPGVATAPGATPSVGHHSWSTSPLELPSTDEAAPAAIRTLPRDVMTFTGRHDELERLLAAVSDTTGSRRVLGISAIDGMAGIGKTALAVHVAHRLALQFPDGQLFVDLRAHVAGQPPVAPIDALRSMLLVTGLPAQRIPQDLETCASIWRDRVAGKRLLILLDDAASHQQVRPLLPGAESCLVLITSRHRLAALEDIEVFTLGTLPPGQATELFERLVGARSRSDAGSGVTAELMELCGYLPLAIRLLAGRLRSHPTWGVRELTERLRDSQDRLAELHAENVAVEAAFDLSYQDLSPDQQRMFRRLGIHPGREIDVFAVAALDGVHLAEARRGIEALYNEHLIDEPISGRYRFHDLIRDYSRALAIQDDATSIDAAIDRLLDYYITASGVASEQIGPDASLKDVVSGFQLVEAPRLSSRRAAMAWMEVERSNLSDCLDMAASRSRHSQVVLLARVMHSFLRIVGYWDQARTAHQLALTAARHIDDRAGEAAALNDLGVVHRLTDDYNSALATLTEALSLYRELDDKRGQANAINNIGHVQYQVGQYAAANASLTEALMLYRDQHNRHGQASAHYDLGIAQYLSGEYAAANASLAEALTLYRDLDDEIGQANALHALGHVQYPTGELAAASTSLSEALALYRDFDDRRGQANVLDTLGIVQRVTGELSTANASLAEALTLYRELDDRRGQAHALGELGVVRRLAGDYPGAVASLTEALALYRDLDSRRGQAEILNNLGALLIQSSSLREAILHFRQALQLAQEVDSPFEEARAIEGMGQSHIGNSDHEEGIRYLRHALAIYSRLGVADAEGITATILSLDGSETNLACPLDFSGATERSSRRPPERGT